MLNVIEFRTAFAVVALPERLPVKPNDELTVPRTVNPLAPLTVRPGNISNWSDALLKRM